MADFRKVIDDCNLVDVGCTGYPFTWSNRKFGLHFIEERLDRFFYNKDWENNFYDSASNNLITWASNHSSVLMEVKEKSAVRDMQIEPSHECIMKICGVLMMHARI